MKTEDERKRERERAEKKRKVGSGYELLAFVDNALRIFTIRTPCVLLWIFSMIPQLFYSDFNSR